MNRIDRLCLEMPYAGSRMLRDLLNQDHFSPSYTSFVLRLARGGSHWKSSRISKSHILSTIQIEIECPEELIYDFDLLNGDITLRGRYFFFGFTASL